MQMVTMSFNKLRELNDWANKNKIQQERIVNIFSSADGTFQLVYYEEE